MADRRYSDDEVAAIFAAASRESTSLPSPRIDGLTLADIQAIGSDVGIAPESLARAADALDVRQRATTYRLLGLPIGVERSLSLRRRVSDDEWDRLVVELREVFHAKGVVSRSGSLREWTNGNLQALLEPTETGHRLRLRTLNGGARAAIGAGTFALGVSVVVATATMLSGHLATAVPGIAFLALAGAGMIASGVLRVPSWARERAQQMEALLPRLAAREPDRD